MSALSAAYLLASQSSFAQTNNNVDSINVNNIENINQQNTITIEDLQEEFNDETFDLSSSEVGYGEKYKNANLDDKNAFYNGGGDFTKYGRDIEASGMYAKGQKLNSSWWCKTYVDWLLYQTISKIIKKYDLNLDAAELTCDLLLQKKGGPVIRVSQMCEKFEKAGLVAETAEQGDIVAIEKIQLDDNGIIIADDITHTALVVKSEQTRNGYTYFFIGEGNSPNAKGEEKGKVRRSGLFYKKDEQGHNILYDPNAKPNPNEIQIVRIFSLPYEIIFNKILEKININKEQTTNIETSKTLYPAQFK